MGGLGFMIPGMGCQREEVRWEDKWAGSPPHPPGPEYCGGISELWPNFSSRQFLLPPISLLPRSWDTGTGLSPFYR